ncbi:hypothetical protein [Halorientalis halophila]|uniref:hypothetical protein n=1 Tax=Halorientalis halophila TaxID=3108499 RepID=UPI00300B35E0
MSDGHGRNRNGDLDGPLTRWAYVTGDRLAVAGVLSVLFVALAALLVGFDLVYVGAGSNFSTVLSSGMLSGLLTLLTVALSVNQLVLSRVFGSAGSLSDELAGTLEFRRSVEAVAGVAASPNEPGEFLALLGDTLGSRVEDLRRGAGGTAVSLSDAEDLDAYADAISTYAGRLSAADDLDDTFEVLLLTLGTDYADHMDTSRALEREYGEELPSAASEALDDVVELLKAVATMRQFFKTVTLQQELAMLSRHLIYTGVPAILVTYFLSAVYSAAPNRPPAIDPSLLPFVVVIATGVILAPLAVLVASLLRVATVSLYTVSIGSFVPPEKTFGGD